MTENESQNGMAAYESESMGVMDDKTGMKCYVIGVIKCTGTMDQTTSMENMTGDEYQNGMAENKSQESMTGMQDMNGKKCYIIGIIKCPSDTMGKTTGMENMTGTEDMAGMASNEYQNGMAAYEPGKYDRHARHER